uniref:PPM-type phosphatase domain-containing protein n=1 Tax=Arcella intermedia TaxID=1963864 RepID=A0A6B2L9F7_9EUKA
MEDTHKRLDDVKAEFEIGNFSQVAYYGVYDGHGGAQTAQMVLEGLHSKIFNSESFTTGDIDSAIRAGFQAMDQYVVEEANKTNAMHGCTCVCSLVLDDKIYFANIGDSEGILISVVDGKPSPKNMTKPHKANDPSEKGRIESLGGHVFFGRVYGSLAVSRSFGDAKYKKPKTSQDFVSWEPNIVTETLDHSHRYVVLACDGLWDVMTHQDVADLTHRLFEDGKEASYVAKALVVRAIRDLQTDDNVTVIVIKINWDAADAALDASLATNLQQASGSAAPTPEQSGGSTAPEGSGASPAPEGSGASTAAQSETPSQSTPTEGEEEKNQKSEANGTSE